MKAGVTDGASVSGAILAALCCAGNGIILAALSAVGLGFLRRDAILWPVMLASLAVAVWGFWQARTGSRWRIPLVLGTLSALSLAAGVIVVHGPPAMTMIYGGAIGLLVATLLNARARRQCEPGSTHLSA